MSNRFASFLPFSLQTGPQPCILPLDMFASVWTGSLLDGNIDGAEAGVMTFKSWARQLA
jgi:hypothetical protein